MKRKTIKYAIIAAAIILIFLFIRKEVEEFYAEPGEEYMFNENELVAIGIIEPLFILSGHYKVMTDEDGYKYVIVKTGN